MSSGFNPNERTNRKWAKVEGLEPGWLYRNADDKDRTLVKHAGKLAFARDGRVYVSSESIKDRLDRGLMIRE